ncbi:uncharacterized protein GGS22DRAFT_195765 [Annulohypoxylon maeteangense]|uniref:uncharacterized protein n=1 Tax=Annulohypoxylon maeteangense TaxID=1927788 RepID=UPI0020083197|nr:uncharacterized protein GGS22DRAFT_195765 [Annulohypoxylon maeteangense]KAI0882489.1 hypothetical protein GGS22DRAFT_195765 [Annulohypoxylon maeteangense]
MASHESWLDSDSDVESDVSSIIFNDQESFTTFRFRVIDFVIQRIWPYATAEEITVEQMSGEENRIIKVSRQPVGKPESREQYVIRIPKYDIGQLNSQVANLRFLRLHGKIPAPIILTFDKTSDNILGSKFIIQDYIPGTNLLSSYSSLTHEQRCRVARELGCVYHELLATRSDTPGFLTLSRSGTSPLRIVPLEGKIKKFNGSYDNPPTAPDVHKCLVDVFLKRWVILDEPLPGNNSWPRLRDKLCQVASEMKAGGWFRDCHTSLAHLNLVPRNILVNPTTDTTRPIISGILDWDSSVFVPQFMGCQPPMWLWAWNNGGYQDESQANAMPPTPEARQLKRRFEEAAGQKYLMFAYAPAYRLARRLVRFAVEDIRSNEDYKEAEQMVEEWTAMRGHLKVRTPSEK